MAEITEQFIVSQAPNAAAVTNGRKLYQKGSFSARKKTADGLLYWADCAGSGKNPYHTSVDCSNPAEPVCRCSCPSRQFPCKHAIGLLFTILEEESSFETAEIPADIAEKRAKQAARTAKKEAAVQTPAKPKKTNTAARAKKIKRQLEGLDIAEKMVDTLLTSGLGTLAGTSAQSFDKLAKDLGSYYLTGPQGAFSRIALAVRTIQEEPDQADAAYAEALRVLVSLHSIIKKSRVFLQDKLEAQQFSSDDSILFEALGGVWRLEDLHTIGAYRENARLVQLSFDVLFDKAKNEYIDRGYWIDLDTGRIDQTQNLRPVKAVRYIKADDSQFSLLEVPVLYTYPGEGNRRIRWDQATPRAIAPEEQAHLLTLAQPDLAAAVKLAKGQMKNTLLPKFVGVLVPFARLGMIDDQFVLEDAAGKRMILRDRPEDGEDHASTERLELLPQAIPAGSALFGLLFYDNRDHSICLHPYSVVTPQEVIRLQY